MDSLNGKTTELFDILTEGGNLLADIGDLLDHAQPAGPVKQAAGSIPELLLTALMNRTAMAPPDGTETGTEQGAIREGTKTDSQTEGTD